MCIRDRNIFDDTNESANENNQQDEIDQSDENQDSQSPDSDENDAKKQQEDNQGGIDSEYDFSEHKVEDQTVDSDSENQTGETIIQKYGTEFNDKDYKVFTKEFDEISTVSYTHLTLPTKRIV